MKKLAILFLSVVTSFATMAQAPQAFAFQSTITDSLGNPLDNQAIAVQFDVHSTSGTGSLVYSETQNATTSATGYFSANVGQGVTTDDFSAISWGTDTYWLEVLVDTTAGTSFVSLGASQLLSVPYALHSGSHWMPAVLDLKKTGTTAVVIGDTILKDNITIFADLDDLGLPAFDTLTGVYTVPVDGAYRVEMACTGSVNYLLHAGPFQAGTYDTPSKVYQLSEGDLIYITVADVNGDNTGSALRITQLR